jgi:hypothetical protein
MNVLNDSGTVFGVFFYSWQLRKRNETMQAAKSITLIGMTFERKKNAHL